MLRRSAFLTRLRDVARVPESPPADGLRVVSSGTAQGLVCTVTLAVDPDGRFVESVESELPTSTGFDRERGWHRDPTGHVGPHEGEDLRVDQLVHALGSNRWLFDRPEHYFVTEPEVCGEGFGARLAHVEARSQFYAIWDCDGRLRRLVEHPSSIRQWTFEGRVPSPWGDIPASSVSKHGWLEDAVQVDAVELRPAGEDFLPPRSSPADFVLDATATLPVRKTVRGAVASVEAQLDGRSVGRFLIDTGASINAVTQHVADQLRMRAEGRTWVETSDGGAGASFRRGADFALGPFSHRDGVFLELDGEALKESFRTPLAGICGYDFFARCRVELSATTITLQSPHDDPWPDGIPVWFEGRVPVVHCRCPQGDLALAVDTGSAGQVVLHPPAVWRLGFKVGRPRFRGRGLTGVISFARRTIPWLDVGGVRFERVELMLSTAGDRGPSGIATDGTIGWGLLKRMVLGLDYPHRQIRLLGRSYASSL